MMKRLFSKRSGFTLVEILVAVAIFAIMSTMIAEVLQMSIKQRQSNKEYGEDLARQENQLLKVSKEAADYQVANKAEDYSLAFKSVKADGSSGGDVAEVKLPYAIKDPGRGNTAEGINYFVSPVPYDMQFTPGSVGTGGGGGGGIGGGLTGSTDSSESMGSLVDVRIIATRGMRNVDIKKVEKKGTPEAGAAVRYVFTTSANSTGMNSQDKAFAEYKLYFYLKDKLDPIKSAIIYTGTDKSGTEFKYTMDVRMAANIISAGYCDSSGNPCDRSNGTSPVVRNAGSNCVTVSVPMGYEGGSIDPNNNYSGRGFNNETTMFYVDFEEDPQVTAASFGSNGSGDESSGYSYALYDTAIVGGAYKNNFVYGAYGTTTDPTADGGYVWRKLDGTIITADDL